MLKIEGQKFELGQLSVTPGVLEKLTGSQMYALLRRHALGDWGDVDNDDANENELALKQDNEFLFSAYRVGELKIWVITEADRSSTTISLPEEY